MTAYKPATINAQARQRAARIVIVHPHDGQPHISYSEERLIEMPDGSAMRQYVGELSGDIDLADTIAMRDPATLALNGHSLPVALVYQALLSDYLNRAEARDQPGHAPDPETER